MLFPSKNSRESTRNQIFAIQILHWSVLKSLNRKNATSVDWKSADVILDSNNETAQRKSLIFPFARKKRLRRRMCGRGGGWAEWQGFEFRVGLMMIWVFFPMSIYCCFLLRRAHGMVQRHRVGLKRFLFVERAHTFPPGARRKCRRDKMRYEPRGVLFCGLQN